MNLANMSPLVLAWCTFCTVAFAKPSGEKLTYEEILRAAKAGEIQDSGPTAPVKTKPEHVLDVPAPTDDAKIGKPPDFKKPPVHPRCPWTWLEYLGLVMIGCVVTGSFLFCYICKRKIGWAAAN